MYLCLSEGGGDSGFGEADEGRAPLGRHTVLPRFQKVMLSHFQQPCENILSARAWIRWRNTDHIKGKYISINIYMHINIINTYTQINIKSNTNMYKNVMIFALLSGGHMI